MQTIQRCLHPGPKILTLFKKTTVDSERITHEFYIKLISWVAVYSGLVKCSGKNVLLQSYFILFILLITKHNFKTCYRHVNFKLELNQSSVMISSIPNI